MRIFAISDLHLSAGQQKPMDVFGPHWKCHAQRIEAAWRDMISSEDLVLIPGDLSWAMTLAQAQEDFVFLRSLPGIKIFLRGNHDYWWGSLSKVRTLCDENLLPLQNEALRFNGYVICGSRCWNTPLASNFTKEDEKIYQRELIRLKLSLEAGQKLLQPGDKLICMTHYPPLYAEALSTGFTELIEAFSVDMAIYGHLHGAAVTGAFEGIYGHTEYKLVSCDKLGFKPMQLY